MITTCRALQTQNLKIEAHLVTYLFSYQYCGNCFQRVEAASQLFHAALIAVAVGFETLYTISQGFRLSDNLDKIQSSTHHGAHVIEAL